MEMLSYRLARWLSTEKDLPCEPDDQTSIPEIHAKMEEENQSYKGNL